MGAVEIVSDREPAFYSKLFLVEELSGGWKPVADLSSLSAYVTQTRFLIRQLHQFSPSGKETCSSFT